MSNRSSASGQKVNDQNRQPQNQQQVDQSSAHMQTETQKPQNQKNNKNGQKHVNFLRSFHRRIIELWQMEICSRLSIWGRASP
jgi:hypothetical protein